MSNQNYLLEIELLHVKPKIWRNFTIPSNISLHCLHEIIQIVMGWENSHLYEFKIGPNKYIEDPEEEEELLESEDYNLCDLLKNENDRFEYLYDFGDYWEHLITVKNISSSKRNLKPKTECLDGAGACPLEDVGGALGHLEFCKIIKDPKHEEYKNFIAWAGKNYDSEKFNRNRLNLKLEKYKF